MKKSFITFILFIIVIGLANCGSGGNSGIVPNINTNPSDFNPTPTPILINKPVQGYMYVTSSVTEEGENIEDINILDVPAFQPDSSGNEPLVSQVSNSLKQDYPEDWAKPEIQDLYSQLNSTLSQSKPLPKYNSGAQVYSVYQDSISATPIPINTDGYFNNSVLTGAEDSTVKLEIALGEDNYAEVETIASSDSILSSDATNAVLKSCPEKIVILAGEEVIFKIFSENPTIDLKKAGLKISLTNPSLGSITQPIYLCIGGEKKYQVAYSFFHAKKGLNTPVDTTITATTDTGLTLSIFTEIIKSTASISGTVYTGGKPLIKGYVKSIGSKAHCKLDENGNYILPKVFCGHGRKVICTYWVEENSKKVRYREEKVIDFFNQDVTGFDFGVPPTPTPTYTSTPVPIWISPGDPYINGPLSKIDIQFLEWCKEFGEEQARDMAEKWLNGEVEEPPVPENIVKAVRHGKSMIIYFANGAGIVWSINFDDLRMDYELLIEDSTPYPPQKNNNEKDKQKSNRQQKVDTFFSTRILILSPIEYNYYEHGFKKKGIKSAQWDVADYLAQKDYKVDAIRTSNNTITINYPPPLSVDVEHVPIPFEDPQTRDKYIFHEGRDAKLTFDIIDPNNLVRPSDFINRNMKDYGIIYINSHTDEDSGFGNGIQCSLLETNDRELSEWTMNNRTQRCENNPNGFWYIFRCFYKEWNQQEQAMDVYPYYALFLLPKVLEAQAFQENSLVYIDSCHSWDVYRNMFINKKVKVFIGYDGRVSAEIGAHHSYEFFSYLIDGSASLNPNSTVLPFSVGQAYNSLTNNPFPNDPHHATLMFNPDPNQLLETYFPVPINITIEQAKENR